jgi:UDP-N-acetylglucosamine 1-carboxyvinyltransferase
MSSFEVIGGKRLSGEIVPQGAKNETCKLSLPVLLTFGKSFYRQYPGHY